LSEKSPYKKHPFKKETESIARLDFNMKHCGNLIQSQKTGFWSWICSCGGHDDRKQWRFDALHSLELHYEKMASKSNNSFILSPTRLRRKASVEVKL